MTRFALNHITAPRLDVEAFFRLAKRLGLSAVEIRNDLEGVALKDGTAPETVREAAAASGLTILSINALQRFNEWTPEREAEARALADEAKRAGSQALVLCPVNEEGWRAEGDARHASLAEALEGLAPILEAAGLVGLVEPLGFAECSLRFKREAADVIAAASKPARFKLVHDTFHHHVAGETELFPELTGLVHISGVEDPSVPRETMRDPHRVLVGPRDTLDNIGQIRALTAGGYDGPLSFEPFAAEVAASRTIEADLRESMDFVAAGLSAKAA